MLRCREYLREIQGRHPLERILFVEKLEYELYELILSQQVHQTERVYDLGAILEIHIPLIVGLREEQVHSRPKLHATLPCMAELVGYDCQILRIYSVHKALEDDFLILGPDLRVLGATLPLHPLEEP